MSIVVRLATAARHVSGPVIAAAIAAALLSADAHGQTVDFDTAARALTDLRLDQGAVASVASIELRREEGRIDLVEGTLTLLEPIDGHRVGAVFDGTGRFRLSAPIAIEAERIETLYGERDVDATFEGAFLLFTDGTLAELADAGVEFSAGEPGRRAEDLLDDADEYLVDDDTKDVVRSVLRSVLHPDRPEYEYFHAHMFRGGERRADDDMFFDVDRSSLEEVSFGRAVSGDTYELIASFRPGRFYLGDPAARQATKIGVVISHYEIDATIESNLDFTAEAHLILEPVIEGGSWVAFGLTTLVEVDSLRWASGERADYRRGKDGYDLWLRIPDRIAAGTPATLTLWYHSDDLLEDTRDWYYLRSATAWYPRHGSHRATFDLTFRTPRDREIQSVGEQTENRVDGDTRTTRWVTPFASTHASFNYGEMVASRITDPRIPPVELTMNEAAHRTISRQRAALTGLPEADLDNVRTVVESDLANSISFFQTWFGTPPMTDLRVTEIPFNHGQAFPGMIHLSWITYEGMGDEGYDEMFRAHEVAHQWWGLGVEPHTYRDRWIAEGFAEFAGLWYLNTVLQEPEKYLDRLRDTKDDILSRRDKAGPIGLGTRAGSRDHPRDYQRMIYDKGAWVLHMLRNLFVDLETLDETRFVNLLRDFYRRHVGGEATTVDFQRVVEEHIGMDMGWFFDQWVNSSRIPDYRVSYCGVESEDGQFMVTARVEQERVPDTFQMLVPIRLDFGDEGSARFRIRVGGPLSEVPFPPLPRKPDRIVFNEFESVLADVDDDGWKCD